MSFVVLRCRNCGSGIDVQPDNLLTVCSHCGNIYPSADFGEMHVLIVPSPDEATIREAVIDRMAADRDMRNITINITAASGVYVPLFINQVEVDGHWRGYRNQRRNKTTVKIWKDGDIHHRGDFPILARKHAHEFGLQGLGRVWSSHPPVMMSAVEWESAALPVLSVDMTGAQTDAAVQDNLIDLIGEGVKSRHSLTAITEFDAQVRVEGRLLLLVPLWTVIYRYRGGSYRVAVGGGGARVLSAMEPMFFSQRILRLAVGVSAVMGTGVLWYVGVLLLPVLSGDEDSAGALFAIGAGILACAWAAWRTAKALVASVNVEHIGEKRGLLS